MFCSSTFVAGAIILAGAIPAFSQGATQPFKYVFPRFNSNAGSELVVSNLSSKLVTSEFTVVESTTQQSVTARINFPAGSQQRFTAASFGLGSFTGSIVINSPAPLSAVATLADQLGNFETVQPAASGSVLIVPFGQSVGSSTDLTIFSQQATPTSVLVSAIASDGSTIGSAQRVVPAFGVITENLASLIPPSAFGLARDVSYVVVRALSNIFGGERLIYAQATLNNFEADGEGIIGMHADPGVVNGVPSSSGAAAAVVPFFVQGGDYVTMLQAINLADSPASVTLAAVGPDDSLISGTNPAVVQIPANGAFRRNIQNIFNFPAGVRIGSIRINSSAPIIATAAFASVAQNGFILLPASEPASTNFAFRTRAADANFYLGLAFRNTGSSTATLTVLNVPDDGSGVSSETLTVPAFALVTTSLLELMAEARTGGFIYVSSNVPILAQAIEGRGDNGMLGNLPAMHSQPDFVPPSSTKFLITGTVRHNGAPLSGVSVQLSGVRSATAVTDDAGNYQFADVSPGAYTVRAVKNGYALTPAVVNVTITGATSRDHDFAATLTTPAVSVVLPNAVLAGSSSTDVIVAASPIISTSEILFEGVPVITSVTSAGVPVTVVAGTGGPATVLQLQTVLKATIPESLLASPRVASIAVRNSGPGGSATSVAVPFAVGSPAPTITAVTGIPTPLVAGNPGFTITVIGTGFVPGTTIVFGTTSLVTTFISETQLQAVVPASALADGGVQKITAVKPSPTIGPSNELTVSITSPVPEVSSVSPNSAEARLNETAPPMPITVRGFNFVKSSVVQIDGEDVSTQYRSANELVGLLSQSQTEKARSALISVKNPDPVTNVPHFNSKIPFMLYNPVPAVTSVDASVLTYDGTPRFEGDLPVFGAQIAIHGTNFAKDTSLFRYLTRTPCIEKTGVLTGERVSSTLIIGRITIACTGLYEFGATNLQPGGGVSGFVGFNVDSYTPATSQVTVSGLAPAAVVAGVSSFTLTISGSNFHDGAYVNFGSAVLIPTSVTANTITVTIPSFLVRTSGVVPVSVTNLDTTGNSNRILFTVN